jgi:2',3'-cyclic-nucleotide 2'-phosphodiesterase (5'-nucleotidase family)
MRLTGAQLKRSLAVRLTAVSGLRVVYDQRQPMGSRLVSVTLEDGSPILDSATYTVAINDFMQAGGDDYAEFSKGIDVKDAGIRLRDVVSEYIKTKKVLSPVIDGRIQIIQ